jgi:hypothetical protein
VILRIQFHTLLLGNSFNTSPTKILSAAPTTFVLSEKSATNLASEYTILLLVALL